MKDKLFFFGNFESQQYNVGNPVDHTVPDTSATATDPKLSLVGACQRYEYLGHCDWQSVTSQHSVRR